MAKIDISFFVTSSPYELRMSDTSTWGVIEDSPSIVEVTIPGYTSFVTHYWDKNKVNIANSNTLDITCPSCENTSPVTLPDGIYKIVVKGSPEKYSKTKYYLKTDLFDMEKDKLFIENIKCINNKDFIDKLTEIEFLMEGAAAHLRYGDNKTSGQQFETAQRLLEDLVGCRNCK